MKNPDDILASTTEQIQSIIDKILKIEKEYEYIQNIESNSSVEKEISERILAIFDKEINE